MRKTILVFLPDYIRLETEFVLETKLSGHWEQGGMQVAHKHNSGDVDSHIFPLPRGERVPVAGHG